MSKKQINKVVIIWPDITGYLDSCIKELANSGISVLVFINGSVKEMKSNYVVESNSKIQYYSKLNREQIVDKIREFRPNIILVSVSFRGIRYDIAKEFRKKHIIVGAVDVFVKKSLKQRISMQLYRSRAIKTFDALFVPGYLGTLYAQKLGFNDDRIFKGLYSANSNLFREVGENRKYSKDNWPKRFLFIGQYIERKGIVNLLNAYKQYREKAEDPWDLYCVGGGPLKKLLKNQNGVVDLGLRSNFECANLMRDSGAFILPSHEDHWGVVIHEAGYAGLPLLISKNCGAHIELVQEGSNGLLFDPFNIKQIVEGMNFVADGNYSNMGKISYNISTRISTEMWKEILINVIPNRVNV